MSHIFAYLIFLSLFWLANHGECSGHRRTSRDAFPALKTDTRFQRSSNSRTDCNRLGSAYVSATATNDGSVCAAVESGTGATA
jgi:hypothetical protein